MVTGVNVSLLGSAEVCRGLYFSVLGSLSLGISMCPVSPAVLRVSPSSPSLCLPPGLPSPDLGAAWTFPVGPVSVASTCLEGGVC